MNIEDITDRIATIQSYQTTDVELEIEGSIYQIDFIDKQEFKLAKHVRGLVKIFNDHPLLIDYNQPSSTAYINSKAADPKQLAIEIKKAIEIITLNWRSWEDYITNKNLHYSFADFLQNLTEGNGLLINGPDVIVKAVIAVCEANDIKTTTFENDISAASYKLLIIDDYYVIAKEFNLETSS
ncbi:MAG: hypothetical protein ABI480_08415 [Chitinophagaceae bacterium]